MNETYECRNCFFVGALDQHGRCARCDSEAVITQQCFRDSWPDLLLPVVPVAA